MFLLVVERDAHRRGRPRHGGYTRRVEPAIVEVAPGIRAIDTLFGGRERYTAAYLIDARRPILVETGPTTSHGPLTRALARLGVDAETLGDVVLTHIHLDHGGGIGRLARAFPRATVWVHEAGARHLADPSRLVASTERVYGPLVMRSLFGEVEAVDASRIRPLHDGDRIDLGDRHLDVLATPGHARHQVALVDGDTGSVFTGDALGIHPPDLPILRPATPPPDFDLDQAVGSIERIRTAARGGGQLLFAHYGPVDDVDRTCDLAVARFGAWTERVREAARWAGDVEAAVAALRDEARRDAGTGSEAMLDLDQLEVLTSLRMNAEGILRYLERRGDLLPADDERGT